MIKIRDIAYARFRAPDLDLMERFLTDFGFTISARRDNTLYARGTDPAPYVHVTEQGAPGFLGLGFETESAEDLQALAEQEGLAVEEIPALAGGQRVRMLDPNGYQIDAVFGRAAADPIPVAPAELRNCGSERRRFGARRQLREGTPQLKRMGHAGLLVRDFRESEAWYKARFGLLASDEIFIGDPSRVIAAFLRCDRGATYTDHHTLVLIAPPDGATGLDHVSFEVEDIDDVMIGHEHLQQAGYKHKMGAGRHILGSQVYDYWHDPWGHVLEHYADGDLLDSSEPAGHHEPGVALGSHWGSLSLAGPGED